MKSLEPYRGKRGITFYDNETFDSENIEIDSNDLEVFLIKINQSNKILITVKCLFIIQNEVITRIDGRDIEDYNLRNFINAKPEENGSFIEKTLKKFQSRAHKGNFRITMKDGVDVQVKLPKRDFVYCLTDAIKKLIFVNNKYQVM